MSPRHRGRRHGGGHAAGQNGATPAVPNGEPERIAEPAVEEAPPAPRPQRIGEDRRGPGPRPGGPRPAERPLVAPAAEPMPTESRPAPEATSEDGEAEERAETGAAVGAADGERKPACTLAQMRRFIKSRPYVPVHELRRRFEIEGIEDEVCPMETAEGMLFVGLPPAEAGYLGELVRGGDVGYELLLDPTSPAVVGVFPMRPVARQ